VQSGRNGLVGEIGAGIAATDGPHGVLLALEKKSAAKGNRSSTLKMKSLKNEMS